jgi:hypothetical protein
MPAACDLTSNHDYLLLTSCPTFCLHSYVYLCADIKYGSLLEVDETLKKLRGSGPKTGEAMLVEEVGPEEIAGVVSKWTGGQHHGLQQGRG